MNPHFIVTSIAAVALLAPLSASEEKASSSNQLPSHIGNSEGLVNGAEFQDLILPLTSKNGLRNDVWGADTSKPRDPSLGIEDAEWSYWGGNVFLADDGKYHCFVARWPENSKKGHWQWPRSEVAHAVADDPVGPWTVLGTAYPYLRDGLGHNPEVHRLKDGRYALWLNKGLIHVTEGTDVNGKWKDLGTISSSPNWHRVRRIQANPSIVIRQDGSILFCSRAGDLGIASSGDPLQAIEGISVTDTIPFRGCGPEDPAIWKTGHQYHLMFNYWQIRTAIKLRSHDGVNWQLDPGIAYTQQIERYTDGTLVDWYKAERPKIVQDAHGRATHLSVAMIDVKKDADLGSDNHSSKHLTLPLVVEGLSEILNQGRLTPETNEVKIKLIAEDGFNPLTDVDVKSLQFGDPKLVDYGKAVQALSSAADGADLIVTFKGTNFGFTEDSFTGKILGKRSDGSVYFAYPRLPGFVDDPAVLVAAPISIVDGKAVTTVKNFGLTTSSPSKLRLHLGDQLVKEIQLDPMQPYEEKKINIQIDDNVKGTLSASFYPKYQTH